MNARSRRKGLWALGLCCAGGVLGCREGITYIPAETGPDHMHLYASIDAEGSLVTYGLVRDTATTMPVREGEHLVLYSLRRSDFVTTDHAPVSHEMWASLQVSTANAGPRPGGCEACSMSADQAPQVVGAGDRCAIPRFVEGRAFRLGNGGEISEADREVELSARRILRLAWSGDCACPGHRWSAAGPAQFCPLEPTDGYVVPEHFDVAETGTLLLVNQGYVTRVGAPPSAPETRAIEPALLRVLAAGALPGSERLLVSSLVSANNATRARLDLLGEDLLRDPNVVELEMAPHRILAAPSMDAVLLFGRAGDSLNVTEPAIARCGTRSSGLDACVREPIELGTCGDTRELLRDAVLLEAGAGLAVGDRGHLYVRTNAQAAWRCTGPSANPSYTLPDGSSWTLARLDAVSWVNGRVLACGLLAPTSGEAGRMGAVLTASAALTRLGTNDLQLVWAGGADGCSGLARRPEDPRAHVALFGEGSRLILLDDDGGVLEDRAPATLEGIDEPVARLRERGGVLYVSTITGRWFVLGADGSAAPRYGAHVAASLGRALVLTRGDELLLVRADRPPTRVWVDGGGTCASVRQAPMSVPGDPWIPGALTLAATLNSKDELGVAFKSAPSFGVLRVNLSTGAARTVSLPGIRSVSGLAFVTDDRLLVLTDEELHVLGEDDAVIPLPLRARDPAAPVVEAPERVRPRALDARGGVAWAVGPETLVRVVPDLELGLVAETYWRSRLASDALTSLELSAVRSICRDSAIVAGTELGTTPAGRSERRGSVLQLGPGACQGSAQACAYPGFDPAGVGAPPEADVFAAIAAESAGAAAVFATGGVVSRSLIRREVVPFGAITSASKAGRLIGFADLHGRVAALLEAE